MTKPKSKRTEKVPDVELNEILTKEFIGKNYELIMTKNRAPLWLGLFFGPVWFFYRKMYLYGFIIICCLMLLGQILAYFEIPPYISIIISILYLFIATPLYLHHIERKIDSIRHRYPTADEETLKTMVRSIGGTSTLALIIYLAIFFALLLMVI